MYLEIKLSSMAWGGIRYVLLDEKCFQSYSKGLGFFQRYGKVATTMEEKREYSGDLLLSFLPSFVADDFVLDASLLNLGDLW